MANSYLASGSISAFVNTIYENAFTVARDNNLMRNLVTVYTDRSGTAARTSSTWGTATINALTETTDMDGTAQAFQYTSLTTLTPAEVGAMFILTDLRVETDPFAVQAEAGMELGMAMAQKVDSDLCASFGTLTGGTVGTAGGTLTWGHIFAAQTILRASNAPGPYYCVLRPEQWHYLARTAAVGQTVTNAPQFQDNVMANWYVQSVGPVNFFITSNIVSGTAAIGAMFSRSAVALDVRRPARIEPQRNASLRALELNLSMVYGYGVWRKTFGVQLIGTSATPTS